MGSLFSKEPPAREPTPLERIGPEITHLKKKTSVRTGAEEARRRGSWIIGALLCAWVWLYVMDPILYAWHKSEAVRVYLYLHSSENADATQALLDSGIFSAAEVGKLNEERGSYENYFSTPGEAQRKAAAIVLYMKGLQDLRAGRYDQLDLVGKIRYTLFVRGGVLPPSHWDFLTPSVD